MHGWGVQAVSVALSVVEKVLAWLLRACRSTKVRVLAWRGGVQG